MSFIVVIPARYASTRLPGKPLREIAGRPMIEHVWRRAKASKASEVIIATDDARIGEAATAFGARVCMTDASHQSGTDRIAEVTRSLGIDDDQVVVNLQGDEPEMPSALIDQVAEDLERHHQADIATLCEAIVSDDELFDPHVVKVVMDAAGFALYFSRAPVPWRREQQVITQYRHIGIYAYRARVLREFTGWGPCDLERMESLEQLRALWHGRRIRCAIACAATGAGIDTEADLARVAETLSRERSGLS